MEAVDWALAQADPPEVFNYSYGANVTVDDDSYSRFWDAVVDGFGKVATVSAGNGGPNGLDCRIRLASPTTSSASANVASEVDGLA